MTSNLLSENDWSFRCFVSLSRPLAPPPVVGSNLREIEEMLVVVVAVKGELISESRDAMEEEEKEARDDGLAQ